MSFEVGTISAKMRLDTADFDTAVTKVKKQVDEVTKPVEQDKGGLVSWIDKNEKGLKGIGIASGIAFGALALGIQQSVAEYTEAEQAMTTLAVVAHNSAGASQEQVQALIQQAQELQNVGVVADDVIMTGQGMLAQFDLETDAIQALTPALMNYMVAEKDLNTTKQDAIAYANRFGSALQGEFAALDRSGWEFTDAETKVLKYGTTSQKVNALVSASERTYRNLNMTLRNTAGGGVKALQDQLGDLKEAIGAALVPILAVLVPYITSVAQKIAAWANEHPNLVRFIIVAALAITGFITTMVGITFAVKGVITGLAVLRAALATTAGSFFIAVAATAALIYALNRLGDFLTGKGAEATEETSTGLDNLGDLFDETGDAAGGMGDAADGAGKKAAGAMKDITEEITKAQDKMKKAIDEENKSFSNSLKELVIQHREALQELQRDRDDENASFQEAQEDRLRSYQEQTEDLRKENEKRASDLAKSLAEEQGKTYTGTDRYQEDVEDAKIAHERKLEDLQKALDFELQKSDTKDAAKIASLRESIAEENSQYDLQAKRRDEDYNRDLAQFKQQQATKIAELEASLAEENAQYIQRQARLDEDFNREQARSKKEHDNKLADLNARINTEKEIQTKYATDFAAFKDAQLADDITKLKQNHQQRLTEIQTQGAEEIANIREQAAQQQGAFGASNAGIAQNFSDTFDGIQGKIKEALGNINLDFGGVFGGGGSILGELYKFGEYFRLFLDTWLVAPLNAFVQWAGKLLGDFIFHSAEDFVKWVLKIGRAINDLPEKIREIWDKIKSEVAAKWDAIVSAISGKWSAIKEVIKAPLRDAINWLAEKFENTINGLADAINNIKNDVPGLRDVVGDLGHVSIPGANFEQGTKDYPGGIGLVGERGPELVTLPRGAQIFNNDDTRQMLRNNGDININNPVFNSPLDLRQAVREVFAERELQGLV